MPRFVLIGLDGASEGWIKKFCKEGKLPTFEKLINSGILANANPVIPCDTLTNWTTIATGARTETHGSTSFYCHLPGEKLEKGIDRRMRGRTQFSKLCKAEYIWEVARKRNLKTLVLNYPAGWPFKKGLSVAGTYWPSDIIPPQILVSEKTYKIDLRRAEWKNMPKGRNFEGIIELKGGMLKGSYTLNLLFNPEKACIFIGSNKKVERKGLFDLKEKSPWLKLKFKTNRGKLRGTFNFSIEEYFPDSKVIKLRSTPIYNLDGWTNPLGLSEEILHKIGVPEAIKSGLTWYQSQASYLVKLAAFLKKTYRWDLCFLHYHLFDAINHEALGFLHPDHPQHKSKKQEAFEIFEKSYKIADKFIQKLLRRLSSPETYIVVCSDHAALPAWKYVNVAKALSDAGLTKYRWNSDTVLISINWFC